MSKMDTIETIVRQYGGCVTPGINWTWALFQDYLRGQAAFEEIITRFPDIDHRGMYKDGFRYRY
jgi:hypothetical protein